MDPTKIFSRVFIAGKGIESLVSKRTHFYVLKYTDKNNMTASITELVCSRIGCYNIAWTFLKSTKDSYTMKHSFLKDFGESTQNYRLL